MTRKMKDSGIEWIGEIPEDWKVVKIKHLFNVSRGRVISKLEIEPNGKYPVYSSQTENNGIFGYLNTYDYSGEALTWTTDGYAGTVFYRNGKYNCTNICGILQKKENSIFDTDIKFLYYATKMVAEENKRPNINGYKIMSNEMEKLSIPITNYENQKRISVTLDNLISKTNETIKLITQEIQTLEDYKKSVITEAVTKGLDKNVEMKDSGIEWIGEIPKRWEISKIKFLATILNGSTPNTGKINYWDGDIKWVTPKDLFNNKIITDSLKKITEEGYCSCGTNMVPINTILLSTRAPIGTVAIAKTELCTNQGIKSIVCKKKKLNYKFLFYYLLTKDEVLNSLGNGTTFMELSTSSLMNLPIPYTCTNEQNKIVDYLDEKTKLIDDLIASKQKQLEILEEYKKSLIYEYVTGKKEAL